MNLFIILAFGIEGLSNFGGKGVRTFFRPIRAIVDLETCENQETILALNAFIRCAKNDALAELYMVILCKSTSTTEKDNALK